MEDTIAAIATAYGEGGIGIIRISGSDSLSILEKIFTGRIRDHELTYGSICDGDCVIDEVLSVFMKAPRSYTAEDVVEINCHGSMISLRKILALVLEKGARIAEPGEFTKRAFLNGRLDLSQAEAVIDLIKAKSDRVFEVAVSQLEGKLSEKVKLIRKSILDLLVDVTVNIDYPDEDIEELTYDRLEKGLESCFCDVNELLATSESGRMIKEGIRVAIAGKPNVGKSSLMNTLMGESRAIVTDIPGTTRDTIEESVSIRNLPVYLMDTAGIHETDDAVEKIGIERSKIAFNSADFVIAVFDGSQPLSNEDEEILSHLMPESSLVVINKCDKDNVIEEEDVHRILPDCHIIRTSLLRGTGVELIEDRIEELFYSGGITQADSAVVTNVRHRDLLSRSAGALTDAIAMTRVQEPLDIIEIDIRNAFDYLGEIIGETVSDEVIDEVFSRFCLGK